MLFHDERRGNGAASATYRFSRRPIDATDLVPRRSREPLAATWERLSAAIGIAALLVVAQPVYFPSQPDTSDMVEDRGSKAAPSPGAAVTGSETLLGGYVGVPLHDTSNVSFDRPGGTNLTLKGVRWDAEPFKFPVYAGVRATNWRGPFGFMIEFLHDKAISRTGKGAHGSKVTGDRAIPDIVEAIGKLKGEAAPSKLKITDVVERLEFTHGHNMLLPTLMVRLGALTPNLRPYVGVGGGMALPHVEIWPAGEGEPARTNEYQVAGPAAQALLGLEVRTAWGTYFIEYKYTFAWLSLALTGGKTPAWCNCDAWSDLWRQAAHWWSGEAPRYGRASTTLSTHQLVGGAAYRLPGAALQQ